LENQVLVDDYTGGIILPSTFYVVDK
jgi:hypothetical protein